MTRKTASKQRNQPTLFDDVPDPTPGPFGPFSRLVAPAWPPPAMPPPPATPGVSAGEVQKGRDLLAAVRALKALEGERRPPTAGEIDALAKFPGFGPVALKIFPDATGGFKNPTWEAIHRELRDLLTPDEYASAKRTTFNAFYTSPAVIAAVHAALDRLGVPQDALVL